MGEQCLDAYFARRGYAVRRASDTEQRRGIDRWLGKAGRPEVSVEYKTDIKAARTGNAYVETAAAALRPHDGWVYTSEAEWLVYFVPGNREVYFLRHCAMLSRVREWRTRYPTARAATRLSRMAYSEGLLVPLGELRALAEAVTEFDLDIPAELAIQLNKEQAK